MAIDPDDVMTQVGEGIALGQGGQNSRARLLFADLWEVVGPNGDAFHRCAIAHSMADVQQDAREELRWDLLALEAALELTDARAQEGGLAGPARCLFPSLHLNLADDYLRRHEYEAAARHVVEGRAALPYLPDDGYSAMIRDGLLRIDTAIVESRSLDL
jgi:hypothetical protein